MCSCKLATWFIGNKKCVIILQTVHPQVRKNTHIRNENRSGRTHSYPVNRPLVGLACNTGVPMTTWSHLVINKTKAVLTFGHCRHRKAQPRKLCGKFAGSSTKKLSQKGHPITLCAN